MASNSSSSSKLKTEFNSVEVNADKDLNEGNRQISSPLKNIDCLNCESSKMEMDKKKLILTTDNILPKVVDETSSAEQKIIQTSSRKKNNSKNHLCGSADTSIESMNDSVVTDNLTDNNQKSRLSSSGKGDEVTSVIPKNEDMPTKPPKESCDPKEPNVPQPKHKWQAWNAMLKRQYGMPVQYSPNMFRYECYGSLHMVERLELMYKMKSHDGCVNALNFNSAGTRLVSGSDDLDIIIWDWAISEPVLKYSPGHRSNIFQVKFLPLCGDSQLISCARDGEVRVSELSVTGACKSTRKLAQHRGAAHKLAIQADSAHTFLSCGEDAVVYEIDLREGKPEKLVVCKEDDKKVPLYTISINPNRPYEYATGGRDYYVRVYDKRCIRQEDSFLNKYCPEHLIGSESKAIVTSVMYSYNGEEILASYNDEDIYIYDSKSSETSKFLHKYKGHRNSQTVKGVNFFGPKSEFVVSGSDCGYIFIWDKNSEAIVKYMHGDEGGVVNVLEPNPNVPVLATSGLDDDVKIWVPSCEDAPDLSGLLAHTNNNMKERDEERRNEPDFADQMLYFLMQHLRHARRLEFLEEHSSSSSSSDNSSDDEPFSSTTECNQS